MCRHDAVRRIIQILFAHHDQRVVYVGMILPAAMISCEQQHVARSLSTTENIGQLSAALCHPLHAAELILSGCRWPEWLFKEWMDVGEIRGPI